MKKFRFLVLLFVLAGLALYTGLLAWRLLPGASPRAVGLGTGLFFWFILGWQLLYKSASPLTETRAFLWAAWTASVLSGLWAGFVLLCLPLEAGTLIGWLAGWNAPGLSRADLLGVLLAAAALSALGYRQTRAGPETRELDVPVEGLPQALEGLRIAQISDLHVGPTIRRDFAERVARAVEALRPDLVAVTGDLADGSPDALDAHVRPLARLKAPLGVYYVTGNHEYYWGAERWLAKAAELGFVPLDGEGRVVSYRGAKLLVAGVADSAARRLGDPGACDPLRAAATREPVGFKLLLAHRPDACEEAQAAGFHLQLSGHTHGGQFFPFSAVVRLFYRHPRGLSRHGRLRLYVSAGTGYWGPPHRFLVPSEITLLRLTAA